MQIPSRLIARLSEDSTALLNVSNLLQSIDGLLTQHPNFFPEYTNHGEPHVQAVLELADRLIPDEVRNTLEPRHIGYLICAIAIHDLGMFLSVDGFHQLLGSNWKDHYIEDLDNDTWAEAWAHYKAEVQRFSDKKLLQHFGQKIDISNLCIDFANMNPRDYLVIGEFLRRHHPRLAHEIACFGFPGSRLINLIPAGYDEEEQDIIGLLARSHGMHLRDTEDYLSKNFTNAHAPRNCPIFYLMAVLRLADKLDAGNHRAPELREAHQRLLIPASIQEWSWNQALKPTGFSWTAVHDALSIDASPSKSTEYVLLKKWMEELQQELDVSWSVIAEKYSSDYGLTIHRIKSTILDSKSKKHQGSFLAKEAKLHANPELLKLLIDPLYGGNPSCGVRELLQNAVDACVEREHLEKGSYNGSVEIRVDTTKKTFIIQDNGIGMDEDVLLNHFLSAGSSYRRSDRWTKDFAPDKDAPQIARTGKFGVGVLSAFLLGNEVTVTTRHFLDKKGGYQFSFGMDPVQLDIKRIPDVPKGTTLEILLKEEALQYFNNHNKRGWFQWFVFDKPVVTYYLDGNQLYSPAGTIPRHPSDSSPWFKLNSDQYENYLWAYQKDRQFFCNGIAIQHGLFEQKITADMGIKLNCPTISVIDPSSRLDIDLSRNFVLEIPDKDKLVKDLYRYLIAHLLTTKWGTTHDSDINCQMGYNSPLFDSVPLLMKSDSFIPNHPAFVSAANIQKYITLVSSDENIDGSYRDISTFLTEDVPFMLLFPRSPFLHNTFNKSNHALRYSLSFSLSSNRRISTDLGYHASAANIWMRVDTYASMTAIHLRSLFMEDALKENSMLKWHVSSVSNESNWKRGIVRCVISDIDNPSEFRENPIERHKFMRQKEAEYMPFAMDKYDGFRIPIDEAKFIPDKWTLVADNIVDTQSLPAPGVFLEMLHEYLGSDIWIPIAPAARREKFPKAFQELEYYIDRIRR